ncbi:MAG: tungstate ABC transporter substrate-binding protein WtpA [Deltaproteobacteria bacterium]|nr:tungstate ABC transporter substrate-binding protein WtpA [Candidatus Anaeroferrophillus wilburensis]MBN2887711.1 tungstate ABC transporter substrate-binding protein WtpA [Deltaproteobacteria bacterium]
MGAGVKKIAFLLQTVVMFLCLPPMASAAQTTDQVIIFHAGSLSVPMAAIEKAFEAGHPGIDILREAAGSQKCARKITDLHKPCDIMASADYNVIDKLLIPDHATWNIRFASNRMVLCYTDTSTYAGDISPANWHEILARPDVVWGHADPNIDPCGYRSLMVLQLAEEHYQHPGLYQQLLHNRPVENIRPKSVELISLLQTGNMDYAWEYRSVAVQHGLRFIELPAAINLGDYRYEKHYGNAVVEVTGKTPGTTMTIHGTSITYGITILTNAPHQKAAEAFLAFLLDQNGGLKILEEAGQPPLDPLGIGSQQEFESLPQQLKVLITAEH